MSHRYWIGGYVPPVCDVTGVQVIDEFIDGRTVHGCWGFMTPASHAVYGCGLGIGRGQRYKLQVDGRWLKVEG